MSAEIWHAEPELCAGAIWLDEQDRWAVFKLPPETGRGALVAAGTGGDLSVRGRRAAEACEPVADVRGTAEYKRHLACELTIRTLRTATERVRGTAEGH